MREQPLASPELAGDSASGRPTGALGDVCGLTEGQVARSLSWPWKSTCLQTRLVHFNWGLLWEARLGSAAACVAAPPTAALSILNGGHFLSNFLAAAAAEGGPNWLFILPATVGVEPRCPRLGCCSQTASTGCGLLPHSPGLPPRIEFKSQVCRALAFREVSICKASTGTGAPAAPGGGTSATRGSSDGAGSRRQQQAWEFPWSTLRRSQLGLILGGRGQHWSGATCPATDIVAAMTGCRALAADFSVRFNLVPELERCPLQTNSLREGNDSACALRNNRQDDRHSF